MPPPADPTAGVSVAPDWERRFRAARVTLPGWARDAAERCLYLSNASGTDEIYAWDRAAGTHRQVTDRPNGTSAAGLDPSGEWIWWFADTDGDEHGVWMRQPFEGGPDERAAPGLPAAYSAGLALGREGLAVVGSSDDGGTRVHLARSGSPPVLIYEHGGDASVGELSQDGSLLAIEHSEHGDSRHRALRVLRVADGSTIAELWDGPDKGLAVLGFAPVDGDARLLVRHERRGRGELLLWNPASGEVRELDVPLAGELRGEWFRDATAVLIRHEYAARSDLHRLDLASLDLTPLGTPAGVVAGATARPDGSVEFSWSSSAAPPVVRSSTGAVVLSPAGEPAPGSVAVRDVWVDGPGGRIHALLSRPATVAGPLPALFWLHGGPAWHDADAFVPFVAAWVDHGFAVVRVNYRGSTGYGSAWRDAIDAAVGLTELEDIAAVRGDLVARGEIDATRVVLGGASWGGYLTLLGLGTQPDLWRLGIAAVPVADYVAAFEDEMEALKAFDRALFGGSPQEVPLRYAASSPLTYLDGVAAPVLVLAGANDPRCPLRQIENYLSGLRERGAPHEVYRFDAGHGSLVVEERIRQVSVMVDFVRRGLGQKSAIIWH